MARIMQQFLMQRKAKYFNPEAADLGLDIQTPVAQVLKLMRIDKLMDMFGGTLFARIVQHFGIIK